MLHFATIHINGDDYNVLGELLAELASHRVFTVDVTYDGQWHLEISRE